LREKDGVTSDVEFRSISK